MSGPGVTEQIESLSPSSLAEWGERLDGAKGVAIHWVIDHIGAEPQVSDPQHASSGRAGGGSFPAYSPGPPLHLAVTRHLLGSPMVLGRFAVAHLMPSHTRPGLKYAAASPALRKMLQREAWPSPWASERCARESSVGAGFSAMAGCCSSGLLACPIKFHVGCLCL